jgi:predicted nuclease with TOPRIM domain
MEGSEDVRKKLKELKKELEKLYDGVYRKEREMRDKMKRWNGFEE